MDPQTSTAAATTGTATAEPTSTAPEAPSQTAPAARADRQPAVAEAASGAAETAQPANPAPTPDYERQYRGLQGQFQAERQAAQQRLAAAEQARQQAEARAQAAETAAWDLQWRLQGLSPEQIRDNKAVLQERQRIASEKTALAAERQRLRDEQTAFRQSSEPAAKRIVADQIAKEFGVPVERIAHLSHPDLMRELATELRGVQRSGALQQRKTAGTDRAESGGGGGVDVSKMSAHDRIKMGLKQHHAQNARR